MLFTGEIMKSNNMNEKIPIDLNGISKTLLLPLVSRAKFSQEIYSPIHDIKAIELVNALNYDFDHLLRVKKFRQATLFCMARAYHFDMAIKAYLKDYSKAVIVNLGCGLDTAFNRVDNGELTWIDIDLPKVIQLRQNLLPPTNREHYISKSVLDFSWMDDVKKYGDEVFIFAGGLFMYLTENQVKSIFINIATHFYKANLIFSNIFPRGIKHANKLLQEVDIKGVLVQWGIYNGKELETWSPKIELVAQFQYFKGIKSEFDFPVFYKIIMYFFELYRTNSIIHLKFS